MKLAVLTFLSFQVFLHEYNSEFPVARQESYFRLACTCAVAAISSVSENAITIKTIYRFDTNRIFVANIRNGAVAIVHV